MFPQYNPSRVFDEIERAYKLFGEEPKGKLQFTLGGYAVRRTTDGAIWGSSDGIAYYLFTKKEDAEAAKRTIDSNGTWEIIYLGCLWLDRNPLEKTQ